MLLHDSLQFLQIERHHKYNEKENYQHFKICATITNRKTMAKVAIGTKKYFNKKRYNIQSNILRQVNSKKKLRQQDCLFPYQGGKD